jgi:hypothetical protein
VVTFLSAARDWQEGETYQSDHFYHQQALLFGSTTAEAMESGNNTQAAISTYSFLIIVPRV